MSAPTTNSQPTLFDLGLWNPRRNFKKWQSVYPTDCLCQPQGRQLMHSNTASSIMRIGPKVASLLVLSADTVGKACISLQIPFADVLVPIAGNGLNHLTHANGYSMGAPIFPLSRHGKGIKWYVILWQGQNSRWGNLPNMHWTKWYNGGFLPRERRKS